MKALLVVLAVGFGVSQFISGGLLTGTNIHVVITSPTSSPTFDNGTSTTLATLAGTAASPDRPVLTCTWSNNQGGSGTATGTTSWSVSNITLVVGTNVLTVTCTNAGGTMASDQLSVTVSSASGGITCAELGVTCIFETSFTSAQGWNADVENDACGGAGFDGIQTGVKQELDDCVEGHGEEVVTAANYANGAGGRGQRHWVDDGAVNASGFVLYDWTTLTTRKTEVWIRYFIRTSSGIGLTVDHRPNYFNGDNCHTTGSCYFLFEGPSGGLRVTVDGNNFSNTLADFDWNTLFGSNKADDQWHCYEFHVKAETGSSATDGVAEWWIDGTLRYQNTSVDFNTFGQGFGGIVIPESGNFNTTGAVAFPMDIDDVAVSATSRIRGTGCGS